MNKTDRLAFIKSRAAIVFHMAAPDLVVTPPKDAAFVARAVKRAVPVEQMDDSTASGDEIGIGAAKSVLPFDEADSIVTKETETAVLLSAFERTEIARHLGRQPRGVIFVVATVVSVEAEEENSEVIDITPREVPVYQSLVDEACKAYSKAYLSFIEHIERAPLMLCN